MISQKLLRYLLSGGCAFLVDYVVLIFFFYVAGASVTLSTTLGFLSGFTVSFLANRYWVHSSLGKERKGARQVVEYIILVAINYVFTLVAVGYLYDIGVPPYISKIIVMALITVWNYLIFSKYIFAAKKSKV